MGDTSLEPAKADARLRKRKSRQRSEEISHRLAHLTSDVLDVPNPFLMTGRGFRRFHRTVGLLEHAISAVKRCMERDSPVHHAQMRFQEGMMLSTTLGVMLVRTSDLVVLETSRALDNFWIMPGKTNGGGGGWWRAAAGHDDRHRHHIVGQSLWCIVHTDEHQELGDLQEKILQRDPSVMRRRPSDMGLIRMTKSLVGGLAKVVRRRIELLHLSEDGKTFLLGVPDVKEEDMRELVVDGQGMEFLQKQFHANKLNIFKHVPGQQDGRNQGGAAGASPAIRHGLSIHNIQGVFDAMKKYVPDLYSTMGLDSDGVLRQMLFARIALAGAEDYSYYFVPLLNIRMGDTISGKGFVETGIGSLGTAQEDRACPTWWIPGDDCRSRQFPQRFNEADGNTWRQEMAHTPATTYNNFLISMWTGQMGDVHLGSCVGYMNPRLPETVSVSRLWRDNHGIERRPDIVRSPQLVVMETWEGMEEEVGELWDKWHRFQGRPNFIDKADVLPGIWFDSGEILCNIFGPLDDIPGVPATQPLIIKRIPIPKQ